MYEIDVQFSFYDERVSVFVCMSVCLSANISSELYVQSDQSSPNFCACYRWLSLGPPLAVLSYIVYFRFSG